MEHALKILESQEVYKKQALTRSLDRRGKSMNHRGGRFCAEMGGGKKQRAPSKGSYTSEKSTGSSVMP